MLTVKQEKFCHYYIELGNASEAYRRVFSCRNMKPEYIHQKASKLLSMDKIWSRVKELQCELQKRSDISKDEVVKVLTNIVRLNPLDYVEIGEDVSVLVDNDTVAKCTKQTVIIKDLNVLSKDQQRCIKSITPTRFGIKIEFENKIQAIERLSKMFDWDSAIKNILKITKDKSVDIDQWIEETAK